MTSSIRIVEGFGDLLVVLSSQRSKLLVVISGLVDRRYFDGIQGDDLQLCATLFALHGLAAFDAILFQVDRAIAFGTYHSHREPPGAIALVPRLRSKKEAASCAY